MGERIDILTGVGRLVQGSPFDPDTKDQQGNPLVHKTGPNIGQPRVNYYCGIAVPKTDQMANDTWNKLQQAAQQAWPGGQHQSPQFSWKVIDGDGIDANGQPYNVREGFAGCYVFKFSSGYAPKCWVRGNDGKLAETVDPNSIKRGFYIRIYGSTTGNDNPTNPGVYLNLGMIELVGYGAEITSGPDGDTAFGPAAALPNGASATPLAPANQIQMVPNQHFNQMIPQNQQQAPQNVQQQPPQQQTQPGQGTYHPPQQQQVPNQQQPPQQQPPQQQQLAPNQQQYPQANNMMMPNQQANQMIPQNQVQPNAGFLNPNAQQ